MGRVKENQQSFYVCGRCKTKIFHLKSEKPNIPCPDCDWSGGVKDYKKLPSVIKLDLTQY